MKLPSKSGIRDLASAWTHERAEDLASSLTKVERRGPWLSADVPGGLYSMPQRVEVLVAEGMVLKQACSCGDAEASPCRHAVALLLRASDDMARGALPDTFVARHPVPRSDGQRPGYVNGRRVRSDLEPSPRGTPPAVEALRARFESPWAERRAEGREPGHGRPVPEAAPAWAGRAPATQDVREDAGRLASRRFQATWNDEEYRGPAEMLQDQLQVADRLAAAGDARKAAHTLVGVAEGLSGAFDPIPSRARELAEMHRTVSRAVGSLALRQGLPADERAALSERLLSCFSGYPYKLRDRTGIHAASRALSAGWDAPDVVAVLDGTSDSWPSPEVAEAERALLPLRLAGLADRPDEAARCKAAARTPVELALDLVAMGQAPEAAALASASFSRCWEARRLCEALAAAGHDAEFVSVAELGLSLPESGEAAVRGFVGSRFDLAYYVKDAKPAGRSGVDFHGVRLRAAEVAATARQSHRLYEDYKALAGDRWPDLRGKYLDEVRSARPTSEYPRILMDEGEPAAAIAAAGDASQMRHGELLDMTRKVGPDHAGWAADVLKGRTAAILAGGRRMDLDRAEIWLVRTGDALVAAGRPDEFVEMLDAIKGRFSRDSQVGRAVHRVERSFRDRVVDASPSPLAPTSP